MDTGKVGTKIAAHRKELGYTQESLAERLGVSPQAVSKWENGRALPETALLPALAQALDTSIDALLEDSKIQVLAAQFGDGMESHTVTNCVNRFMQKDSLALTVHAATLACPEVRSRPSFLTLKYRLGNEVYYTATEENAALLLNTESKAYAPTDTVKIIAARYGTARASYDVMHKIEHFKAFQWEEYRANHELFPSDPASDEKDYLTLVYVNDGGIHMVTCEEGESIAYTEDKTALYRKQTSGQAFLPNVPMLPAFGEGWECSWAAALTAALQAMHIPATYTQVMGVSGACYRLAFSSPTWDYSSVDGLVAYDYATPGYKAFGFTPKFADRVEKANRAQERGYMLNEIRCGMPVLGINLRVAAEWGVICGYKNDGADLFCRTKYDKEILERPDYKPGETNPFDYLYVDNWPFILTYFDGKAVPPTDTENLRCSLAVFVDGLKQRCDGYAMGFSAYEAWIRDLLDEAWYKQSDDEQLARRFSVNQFCALALCDARGAAYAYLTESKRLLPEKAVEMNALTGHFEAIARKAEEIHRILDSGEALEGERARRFWTKQMRETQARLLAEMLEEERKAATLAEAIL